MQTNQARSGKGEFGRYFPENIFRSLQAAAGRQGGTSGLTIVEGIVKVSKYGMSNLREGGTTENMQATNHGILQQANPRTTIPLQPAAEMALRA